MNVLIQKIVNMVETYEREQRPVFLGFLSPEEVIVAEKMLYSYGCRFLFFGGYDNAERKICVVMPEECEEPDYMISAVTVNSPEESVVLHRHIMGTLIKNVGLPRDSIGDILVEKSRAVVFLKSEVLSDVFSKLNTVANTAVTVSEGCKYPLPPTTNFNRVSLTVKSMRLNELIAVFLNCSPMHAEEVLNSGNVFINRDTVSDHERLLIERDCITVRGRGKFIIEQAARQSKKNRIVLKYRSYY